MNRSGPAHRVRCVPMRPIMVHGATHLGDGLVQSQKMRRLILGGGEAWPNLEP
jgi:hypothetical protein